MICPKCGHDTTGNFCSNCGALLKQGDSLADRENIYRKSTEGRRARAWAPSREEPEIRPETGDESNGLYEPPSRQVREEQTAGKTARQYNQERMETREERQESLRKKEKSRRASRKDSGKKASAKDSGKSGPNKKEVRLEQKEKKLREKRIQNLESEVENLTLQQRLRERRRREEGWDERPDSDSGPDLGELAAKGAAGIVIMAARVMQLASCLLMGCMVLIMLRSFLAHGESLGNIQTIDADRNLGLALYLAFAGISLFMGVVWCLWILSRKGAGGGFRLKKYDTGRGFIPFLICAAAVCAAGPALSVIPPVTGVAEEWQEIINGVRAALTAVQAHRGALLLCSGAGAVLSLIRRILLV